MRKLFWVVMVLLVNVPALYAEEDDVSQGWTPAQQSRWIEAQMDYAREVREHGANSPEATDAQVRMNTLARDLGIKPSGAIPESVAIIPPPAPDLSDLQMTDEVPKTEEKPAESDPAEKKD